MPHKLDELIKETGVDEETLKHSGVKGMKWGVHKSKNSGDIVIKKGTEIHRLVLNSWVDKEKSYTGHAYASYKKEDVDRYKYFSKLMGQDKNTTEMIFTARSNLRSPSKEVRVQEFVNLMKSDSKAKKAMVKATRNPLLYMPKKRLDKLDDPKQLEKAYKKFAFLLVSKPDLRDPYFKNLRDKGYSMIMDDADIAGGISKYPIIVFDREKTLKLKSTIKGG